jgi:hypothetical protein
LGKAARATRRVSSGTGGTSWGCSDIALLRVYQADIVAVEVRYRSI